MTFDSLLATLFTAYRKDVDDAAAMLYERGVGDIPLPLLDTAVTRAIKTRTFLPTIAELRQDAEACRVELVRKHPPQYCDDCRHAHGWLPVKDELGVERLTRCRCVIAWRQQLVGLGVTSEPVYIALSDGREAGQSA